MIIILQEKVEPQQMLDMLAEYGYMIKIVVDIRRSILAGGGEMHSDCESVLLKTGSDRMIFGAQTGFQRGNRLNSNRSSTFDPVWETAV